MIPKELFRKIRQVEITTNRLVTDVFAGQYHSVFKGQGIEFDEVREYQYGDDIRRIDWNVTARTGRVQIKKYVEERELTVMLLVDVSRSAQFGTVHSLKSQLAAEISALIAFSAIKNLDRVGLIVFTDTIEKFIPPRKGRRHVLHVIREILSHQPQGRGTDIIKALEYLNRVANRRTITFLISDFLFNQDDQLLQKNLSIINRRHDLIAITLNDPAEQQLKSAAILALEDAEEGSRMRIDASTPLVRAQFEQNSKIRLIKRRQLFQAVGCDYIDTSTAEPFNDAFIKFFRKRRQRKSLHA